MRMSCSLKLKVEKINWNWIEATKQNTSSIKIFDGQILGQKATDFII